MYNFLKIQYILGRITEEQLKALIGKRITIEQYKSIRGE